MKTLAIRLGVGLVFLLAVLATVLYVRMLRADLASASMKLASAQQSLAARDEVITRLQADEREKAAQQAQLDQVNVAIATTLSSVQQENRKLLNEDPIIRAWADTPLPADISRLHASPALTGARDYVERVPGADALHAASDVTPH